jgi:hypothetical protein
MRQAVWWSLWFGAANWSPTIKKREPAREKERPVIWFKGLAQIHLTIRTAHVADCPSPADCAAKFASTGFISAK